MNKKYIVRLTLEERDYLYSLIKANKISVRALIHARILLKSDTSEQGSGWPDDQIAEAFDVNKRTVERVREHFVEEGLEPALYRRKAARQRLPKIDGEFEARLIALICSDPPYPVICMDESNKQLIKETKIPLPVKPGSPAKYDSEYERNGVRNIFIAFEPLQGKRFIDIREHRKAEDWAHFIKTLVDNHYPDAHKIVLVMNNLNIHTPASLYATFPAEEASRISNKLEIHYTPKHGSWLNVAEIELSVLSRQCLNRRIGTEESLIREIGAWQTARNQASTTLSWRFNTEDARIKLKKLYPIFN